MPLSTERQDSVGLAMNALLDSARRIVIKIGSSLLCGTGEEPLRRNWLKTLCADAASLRRENKDVIIVSSGAIALGLRALRLSGKEFTLQENQAAAAVGQARLAEAYADILAEQGLVAAQILLTLDDTENRQRYLNARATVRKLVALGTIPVVNENDTVATGDVCFGDNDRLAARVADMMEADLLLLLSDVDGLYSADPTGDPNAAHVDLVSAISPEIEAMAHGPSSKIGRGGMIAKIAAAHIATAAGCEVAIANGRGDHPIAALCLGARATRFSARLAPAAARKRWISGILNPRGTLVVDEGAACALREGKSLLPVGVCRVNGQFGCGEAIVISNLKGHELARGLVGYSAADAAKIAGRRSTDIQSVLGFRGRDEMVHRDDLTLTDKAATAWTF